jgi:hypothetical protein
VEDEFELARPLGRLVERFVSLLPPSAIVASESGGLVLEAGGAFLSLSCSLRGRAAGCAPLLSTLSHRAHDGREIEVSCIDFALPDDAAVIEVAFEFRLL